MGEHSSPAGFPYRLVATDLDGTLLRSDQSVSARTREALAAATAADAAHLVVTGRSAASTRRILRDLDYRGLAVCGQGGQLYHAGEDRLLTTVTLDRGVARAAVERLEADLGPLWVSAALDGVTDEFVVDEEAAAHWGTAEGSARSRLWEQPVIKLYVHRPGLSDDDLAERARALVGGAVGVVVSGEGWAELLPLGLTKATGLSLAGRRLGFTAAETIAFGDMPNDVPMLRWAAHGVAMAGAHRELLAVADEVTAGNDADGVAKVLERLLRQ